LSVFHDRRCRTSFMALYLSFIDSVQIFLVINFITGGVVRIFKAHLLRS
jgi:hypothetical protein